MPLDQFAKLYLSWVNDFLTIESFASYYGLTLESAKFIVHTGHTIMNHELQYENKDYGH